MLSKRLSLTPKEEVRITAHTPYSDNLNKRCMTQTGVTMSEIQNQLLLGQTANQYII